MQKMFPVLYNCQLGLFDFSLVVFLKYFLSGECSDRPGGGAGRKDKGLRDVP